MPINESRSQRSSAWIAWTSAVFSIISSMWLLISLDVSLEYFLGVATGIRSFLPDAVVNSRPYRFLLADVTSASPLVVLLTFAIPGWLAWSRRRHAAVPNWCVDGYPRGWITFVIYVGLAATLFGMFEALSAVSTDQAVSPQEQLAQLIAGTATALVSSLVALIASFIAHLFKRAIQVAGWLGDGEGVNFDDEFLQLKERFGDLDACVLGLIDPVDDLGVAIVSVKQEFQNLGLTDPVDNLRAAVAGLHGELEHLSRAFAPLTNEMEPLLKLLSRGNESLEMLQTVASEMLEAQQMLVSQQSEQLANDRSQLATELEQLDVQRQQLEIDKEHLDVQRQQMEIDKEHLGTLRESLGCQHEQLDTLREQRQLQEEQFKSSRRRDRSQRRQLKLQRDQFAWFGDEAQSLLTAMNAQHELQERSYYAQIRVLTALRSMVAISENEFAAAQSDRESQRRAVRAQFFAESDDDNGSDHQTS